MTVPTYRLNPFQLPSATTSRFLLLIVFTLSASAFTAGWLTGGKNGWANDYQRCLNAANEPSLRSAVAVTEDYLRCFKGVSLTRAAVELGAALAVASLLTIGYLLHPRWLMRRQRLVPLDSRVFPAAAQEIGRLLQVAGLSRPPQFLVDPFRSSASGRAFGRRGRYYVRLSFGLVNEVTPATAPVLRAVVRHELAHLRNRDVGRTIVTILSGWVFGLVVVVPTIVVTAIEGLHAFWDVAWRLAAASVLILLVRASVIRAREHYADIQASLANEAAGDEPFLPAAFAEPKVATRATQRGIRWFWSAFWLHPPIHQRAAAVSSPDRLMHAGLVEALATGTAAGLIQPYFHDLARLLIPSNPLYAVLLSGLLLGVLAMSVVGVSLWRASLHALAHRRRMPTGLRPGLALAAGVMSGQFMSAVLDSDGWPAITIRNPLQGSVLAGLLCLGCVVCCRCTVAAAAAWIPSAYGRTLIPALRTGQLVAALAFAAALGLWWYVVGAIAESSELQAIPVGLFVGLFDPVTLVPLLAVAVFHCCRLAGPVCAGRCGLAPRPESCSRRLGPGCD